MEPDKAAQVPAGEPPRQSCVGRLAALLIAALGALYLLNPTMGLVELVPDNLALVGNLDEAGAAGMVILALQYLAGRGRKQTP